MAPRRKHPEPRHTFPAIVIDRHQAVTSAGINCDLLAGGPRYLDDEAPVHLYDTMLELTGVCRYPEERNSERYDMTLYTVEKTPGAELHDPDE